MNLSLCIQVIQNWSTHYTTSRMWQLSWCTFPVPRPKKGNTCCASSPSEQMLYLLEFLVFSQTRSNKSYLCFIPMNSLPKKHPAIGFSFMLVVVHKHIKNTTSDNMKKEISYFFLKIKKWNVVFPYWLIWRLPEVILPNEFLLWFFFYPCVAS